ncbi:hypothetical protein GCM10023170_091600 [Phytohabitans houttuyneae]|uniref:Uncharacterized protein n=2 Tax=Phytohabitans houttuyneae TaxID=1076126 RepID=A0A6V8KPD6_9ACTN|nr:hypothetical protein Phou_086580 [Phytohabitans houttuyneae]
MDNLTPLADVTPGDWIVTRLRGLDGTVGSVVPPGFAAYARVPHPVETGDDPGGDVRVGSLAPAALATLLDVLAPATGDQECYHALWEGWGWVDGGGVAAWAVDEERGGPPVRLPVTPGVSPRVWGLPRLRLPGRDYLLFRGPLRAALEMGWHQPAPFGFTPQSPSLLWPADRSWCVATEVDDTATFVGGPQAVVDRVVHSPVLAATPASPVDKLVWTATSDEG